MTYKILIVEDDVGIADAIRSLGEKWAFEMRICSDFGGVDKEFEEFSPHLVLLDIGLPFFDGYYWCRQLRRASNVPIIVISSASDNMNIVMAMNMGADDFIAKPFDAAVLMAKVQALLRRSYDYAAPAPTLSHRGAVLHTGDNTLEADGEKIELTKNEYRILYTLLENKGSVVSREKLMTALWESDSFIDDNTLTVNVNRLRKKLDGAGLSGFITTKVGSGYLVE